MIYANPVIMYEVECPQCKSQLILFREDLSHLVVCDTCDLEIQVSLPAEEVGEIIYEPAARTASD